MTMNIYIKPELEQRLRTEKSMSGLINELLESHYGSTNIAPVFVSNNRLTQQEVKSQLGPIRPTRPLGEILADIRETERARDESLEFCQDEAEAARITGDAQEVLDALWVEYNGVKGEQ